MAVSVAPACAQDKPQPVRPPGPQVVVPADNATIAQRLLVTSQPERCRPRTNSDGSIVVCGGRAASEKERLPMRDQTDTALSTKDGLAHAPNVSGLRDCSRGCIGIGGMPPPIYYFDIKALPEAPPGSDADRIAKGEIPDR